MKYDYLIVGAGLYGSVFAHLATKQGKRCLVIDKRPQLGGNLYCDKVEGINVHKYGPQSLQPTLQHEYLQSDVGCTDSRRSPPEDS